MELQLPSKYENRSGDPKFDKFIGRPKLSYSAYGSFKEPSYKGEFFGVYFLGAPRTGTIFTEFGSAVGGFMETGEAQDYLTDFDMNVLREVGRPEGAIYEYEIIIDRGSYIIQGYLDRIVEAEDGIEVIDFKTGAIDKKAKDYASLDYQQTTMYAYALEQEGKKIKYSGVKLFDRKGNTLETGNKNVLRLTGDVLDIPTPYSTERAEEFLKNFDKTALEIEEYWKIYSKYFK
jgi:hypothetical protein